jgi:hypothetical protein
MTTLVIITTALVITMSINLLRIITAPLTVFDFFAYIDAAAATILLYGTDGLAMAVGDLTNDYYEQLIFNYKGNKHNRANY